MQDERHSRAEEPTLVRDADALAELEVKNQLRQFDSVREQIDLGLDPDRPFRLRPSAILQLHRVALEGITSYAGTYRPSGIEIGGSKHEPPGAHLVPEFVERLCEYVNQKWAEATAVHLAAFVLWRMNWIHPFVDGNGRTSRAVSYLVLCVRLDCRLPGITTIPELIAIDKAPYYRALEAADQSVSGDAFDLSELEGLLGNLLARQLASILINATGGEAGSSEDLTERPT